MRARKKKLAREKPSSKSKNFYGFKAAQIVKLTLDPGPTRVNAGPKKKVQTLLRLLKCVCACARVVNSETWPAKFFSVRGRKKVRRTGGRFIATVAALSCLVKFVCCFSFQGGTLRWNTLVILQNLSLKVSNSGRDRCRR